MKRNEIQQAFNELNAKYLLALKKLQEAYRLLDEKPSVVEKEVPVEVERAATKDLREAARLMAKSTLNKEDLSEEEIYSILQKSSDDDIKRKLGFWAVPLPKKDSSADAEVSKRYIGKK